MWTRFETEAKGTLKWPILKILNNLLQKANVQIIKGACCLSVVYALMCELIETTFMAEHLVWSIQHATAGKGQRNRIHAEWRKGRVKRAQKKNMIVMSILAFIVKVYRSIFILLKL